MSLERYEPLKGQGGSLCMYSIVADSTIINNIGCNSLIGFRKRCRHMVVRMRFLRLRSRLILIGMILEY